MRIIKKINSIGYGDKILAAAGIFLLVIPAILYFMLNFLKFAVLYLLIKISIAIGIAIIIFLIGLLTIELRQDAKLNEYYIKNRDKENKYK